MIGLIKDTMNVQFKTKLLDSPTNIPFRGAIFVIEEIARLGVFCHSLWQIVKHEDSLGTLRHPNSAKL
jgi:hypothetical protein